MPLVSDQRWEASVRAEDATVIGAMNRGRSAIVSGRANCRIEHLESEGEVLTRPGTAWTATRPVAMRASVRKSIVASEKES